MLIPGQRATYNPTIIPEKLTMENNNQDALPIPRATLLRVISHLETIVISLDRIGSSSEPNTDRVLVDFINDWSVFQRLAECRGLLSELFSRELGEDDMDELERELRNVPYWRVNARKLGDFKE